MPAFFFRLFTSPSHKAGGTKPFPRTCSFQIYLNDMFSWTIGVSLSRFASLVLARPAEKFYLSFSGFTYSSRTASILRARIRFFPFPPTLPALTSVIPFFHFYSWRVVAAETNLKKKKLFLNIQCLVFHFGTDNKNWGEGMSEERITFREDSELCSTRR